MAQTTQIVPKYSFPYVETHINDYTKVVDSAVTEASDNSVIMAYAFASGKGVDNVWVRKNSKSSAVKTFGDSNFKKFGQPLMQALNVVDRENSQVWMMRVMPENATYANSIVSAYYKADTAQEVADPHKRKFRIKLTAKSAKDITTKDDLINACKVLDGKTVMNNGKEVYKDAEGFIQAPFMLVNYVGRGTCGELFSMRMNQAYTYEKEYGIKMYNFEIISSENTVTKDANYVGALVSSSKYGAESATLIDDVLGDVEVGVAPVDVHIEEENVEAVYDAYVEFLKNLHDEVITEYEEKLDTYQIPQGMLDGTVTVSAEYKEKVDEIREIESIISQTETNSIPDLDEFDIIFGCKVASNEMIPCIEFCKKLTDSVDTTAEDYDSKAYTTDDVVDFLSAKGLKLSNGTNGYFDNPRKINDENEEIQYTYEDELTICLKKAYDGSYDKKILSSRRLALTAFFDANYPMEVKKQIVDLAIARNDCRVYLDTGIISSLSTSSIKKLASEYSIFDNHMVSVDIHNYLVKEYSSNKKVNVTINYFLAAQYVDHITNYGYHIPFCKDYVQLEGHIRDSIAPVIEEYDLSAKEILNTSRLNYFECISENVFQRATQNTTQKSNTDLLEENNSTILYNIKRFIEQDVHAELYNFAEETVRNSFIEIERAKYSSLEGTVVESFDISFATSEYEFTHSILHCYLAIKFRGLTKQAIVEIDLNKREYTTTSVEGVQ